MTEAVFHALLCVILTLLSGYEIGGAIKSIKNEQWYRAGFYAGFAVYMILSLARMMFV